MFSELVESVASKKQTKNGPAFVASVIFQLACLVVLLLLPLIYTQALPIGILKVTSLAVASPTPHPVSATTAATQTKHTERFVRAGILLAPTKIPTTIAMVAEAPLLPDSQADANPSAFAKLETLNSEPAPVIPSIVPKQPAAASPGRVSLGGDIQAAKLIFQVQPVYPTLALQAHIEGNVVLHTVITAEGRVGELQVISGHPLLVRAALDAVKQWLYRPTLLNAQPAEVETTITVVFSLAR